MIAASLLLLKSFVLHVVIGSSDAVLVSRFKSLNENRLVATRYSTVLWITMKCTFHNGIFAGHITGVWKLR